MNMQETCCVRTLAGGNRKLLVGRRAGVVVTRYLHLPRVRMSNKGFFKWRQIIVPLLPVPLGCWFLYKALVSFNRNPPPIATDSATVLARPLYAEPVYQVRARLYRSTLSLDETTGPLSAAQGISYKPSTFIRNATPRGG